VNLPLRRKLLELAPQLLALLGREHLRIVHASAFRHRPAALQKIPRYHHRGRHHWPRKRAASHLIDADQAGDTVDLFQIEAA
jgi:hypothetical protein